MTNALLAAMIGGWEIILILGVLAFPLIAVAVGIIVFFALRSRGARPAMPPTKTEVVPPATRRCPQCGATLNPDVPEGLCPACLLKHGIATEGGVPPGTAPFTPPTIPELQKLFPQLEILEPLGQGGMGAVYKARQSGLDRFVALKILTPKGGGDLDFAGRFTREARALARLSHPNIVAVYDFGEIQTSASVSAVSGSPAQPTSPLHYFIMEYVDGMNLRQLEQAGKLSPREALEIIPQICAALQFAHDEGIVHRDIKPENVLIDKKGRVKIADFGLAKILGQEAKDFRLTGARDVMGTPHYMAPEQVEKPQEVDHRADIYSLGVVFYELLTGELPLGKFQPPSAKVRVDVRLDEVVLRSLEKEPSRRYQHASEVKTEVETIAHTPAVERRVMSPVQKPDRFWRWVAVAALVLVAIPMLAAILGMLAAIAIPNFVKARRHAQERHEAAAQTFRSDYIGQEWFPEGDSIHIDSVKRTAASMTVHGHYELASHDHATLALYVTTTNDVSTPVYPDQQKVISKGRGEFELNYPYLIPGLPHVSMYADGSPFASVYFGTRDEALVESKAAWISNRGRGGDLATSRRGLIAFWRAEGNGDDSINGHNGVLENAGYTDGVVGQALAFDPDSYPYGTYTGVKVPESPAFELTNALSIEGWVRPRGNGYIIFCRGDHRPGLDPYTLSMPGDNPLRLRFGICNENGESAFVEVPLMVNEWVHAAGTYDNGLMRLYTNGVLAKELTTSVHPFAKLLASESPGLGIGNLNDGGNNFPFIGDIDELALYGRALSPDEIRADFEAGLAGRPLSALRQHTAQSGLVGSWNADHTAKDSTGHSSGVLMNNVRYAPGIVGESFQFDGQSAYVKIPQTPVLNALNQISIEFWMKADPDNEMQNYQGLVTSDFYIVEISNGRAGPMGVNFALARSEDYGSEEIPLERTPPSTFDNGIKRQKPPASRHIVREATAVWDFDHISDGNGGGAPVSAGEWHYVVGTYDGENLQLYIDGQPWGQPISRSGPIRPMLSRSFLSIGSEDGRRTCPDCIGKRYFKGLIDEVKIYNRALSANEIVTTYDKTKSQNPTLVAVPANNAPSRQPASGGKSDAKNIQDKALAVLDDARLKSAVGAEEVIQKGPSANPGVQPAVSAAQKWLALTDAGKYSESWKQASVIFQAGVTEPAWENSMNAFRKPLGMMTSRKLKSAQFMTELPGAPDGQYVLMQFETSFLGKKASVETVTFMLEKDGQWKAAGYFIK